MKRRIFLQSLGAAALTPALPVSALANLVPSAKLAVDPATYKWAETIVRAHNQSSVGMLQRLLHLDAGAATAMQNELVRKGVLVSKANSFGIHTAVKPLYEGAFVKPHNYIPDIDTPDVSAQDCEEQDLLSASIEEDEQAMLIMLSAVDAADQALTLSA